MTENVITSGTLMPKGRLKHVVRVNLGAKPAKERLAMLAMLLWTHRRSTPFWCVPQTLSFSFSDFCERPRMLTGPKWRVGALQWSIYGAFGDDV